MTAVVGIVAAIIGIAIGYLIGLLNLKKKALLWEERLTEARKKLEDFKRKAASQAENEGARLIAAQDKLSATQKSAADYKKIVSQKENQIKKLQGALEKSEAERGKASEQVKANSEARQQAEARQNKADALATSQRKELEQKDAQLQQLTSEFAETKEKSEKAHAEAQRLRADIAAKERDESDPDIDYFADTNNSLDGILERLMELESMKAVVLSDSNGIAITATGEKTLTEGMAATAHLVGSMCTQLVDLIQFSSVRAFYLQDTQSNVIAGRAFVHQGEPLGLTTCGPRIPSDRLLDKAMTILNRALE